ncbi:uncharacterized protein si:ch1073-357b18.4 [Polyodon spathula]|uniref:uncharacterized protein si:ch1073-357b18.4 n=1 Tax=Polyodon spathula TaxID=7913 RepID=UPI001B7E3DEB|nr:uncharacterized protein si:ch1073-357b18.4 [Polyodon spathula]
MTDNSKVTSWTDEETRLLVALWSQAQAQRTDASYPGKKTHMFREIAAKMLENSFQRSENQCRSRIHVLKRKYLQCRVSRSSGKGSPECLYYKELDAVFASCPVAPPQQPQLLVTPPRLGSAVLQEIEITSDSKTDAAKPGQSEFSIRPVCQEFQASGYKISCEKLKKKWNNLLVTYKRAKERCKENGKAKIAWEYYELMDSILTERPPPSPAVQNGVSVQEVSEDTSARGTAQPSSQEQDTPAHGVGDEVLKHEGKDTSVMVQPASQAESANPKGAPLVASDKIILFQQIHQEEAAAEFNTQTTLLLIQCVSRHWDLYSATNRSQLFHTISKEFQLYGFKLSSEKLRRKWNNLIVTYKRAKERSGIAGKPNTTWEYFQLMDNLFSKKGTPPLCLPPPALLSAAAPVSKTCLFPAPLKLAAAAPPPDPPQPALSLPSSSVILLPLSTPSSFSLPHHWTSVQTPWPPQSTVQTPSPSLGSAVPAVSSTEQSPPNKRVKKAGVNLATAFLTQQTEQVKKHSKMLESLLDTHENKTKVSEQRKRRCEQREKRRERREIAMLRALNRISSKQDLVIQLLQKLAEKP